MNVHVPLFFKSSSPFFRAVFERNTVSFLGFFPPSTLGCHRLMRCFRWGDGAAVEIVWKHQTYFLGTFFSLVEQRTSTLIMTFKETELRQKLRVLFLNQPQVLLLSRIFFFYNGRPQADGPFVPAVISDIKVI